MLQYLVILLEDTSISYCHAINPSKTIKLMPLDVLHKAIHFSMRHNLMVQYVLPRYELPIEYYHEMNIIDHIKIGQDVSVYHCIPEQINTENAVLCLQIGLFNENVYMVSNLLKQVRRLCIHFTDIESFTEDSINAYEESLNVLKDTIINELSIGNKRDLNFCNNCVFLVEFLLNSSVKI